MDIWKSMVGMIEAELTDAEPERTLAKLNASGVELYQLQSTGVLTARMRLRRRDYKRAQKIVERGGGSLRLLRTLGGYWKVRSLIKRPVLLGGLAALLSLSLFLPTRILFVRVEGNQTVPTRQILEEAQKCGIAFGASRREVRSERMKNALLESLPQLQWAGVNTAGSVATISVRERPNVEQTQPENTVSSLIADRDGFILSITATAGSPLVQVGQAVKKGEILISGYTDCGISIRAERAEGEIIAQTSRSIRAVSLTCSLTRGEKQGTKRNISILFGKKRINLWKGSGICDTSCGRMYTEYAVTLPGGFALPLKLCIEEITRYALMESTLPEDQTEQAMAGYVDRYLLRQMIAGEILQADRGFTLEEEVCRMEGTFLCREMLGRRQQERVGAIHGEDN